MAKKRRHVLDMTELRQRPIAGNCMTDRAIRPQYLRHMPAAPDPWQPKISDFWKICLKYNKSYRIKGYYKKNQITIKAIAGSQYKTLYSLRASSHHVFCGKYFPDLEWRLHLHLQGSTTSLALGQHQKQKQQLMSGQDDKIMEEQTTIGLS